MTLLKGGSFEQAVSMSVYSSVEWVAGWLQSSQVIVHMQTMEIYRIQLKAWASDHDSQAIDKGRDQGMHTTDFTFRLPSYSVKTPSKRVT